MATIAQTKVKGLVAPATVTVTSLTASDTLSYTPGAGQVLILQNPTESTVVVTVDGAGATTLPVKGYGSVDVSAGKAISVAAGATVSVELDVISAFLKGAIAVTGGTGVEAMLVV